MRSRTVVLPSANSNEADRVLISRLGERHAANPTFAARRMSKPKPKSQGPITAILGSWSKNIAAQHLRGMGKSASALHPQKLTV